MRSTTKNKLYKKSLTLLVCLVFVSLNKLVAQQNYDSTELDKTNVCMVDDEYKGEQQLQTIIDGKTYYGCCIPCIETLNSDSSFRYGIDPISKIKIDKTDAFIVRKSVESDKVLYFEDKENYQTYLEKSKNKLK